MACTDLVLTGTAATGSGTMHYQWVEGTTVANCSIPIAGCATQNCTIPAANAVGVKVYKRVVVSDECITDIKESAPITVQYQGLKLGTVCWAPANVGNTGKWAQTPDTYGSMFQFNINRAWHPTTPATGVAIISWFPSNEQNTNWNESTNAVCPNGWRLPTAAEFLALHDASTIGSASGAGTSVAKNAKGNTLAAGKFYGPKHATCSLASGGSMDGCIFLPFVGSRSSTNGALSNQGANGYYWSSTQNIRNSTEGFCIDFSGLGSAPATVYSKSFAFPVRCVKSM
jgi:uncharacterized protein (TIGR02145 family)